MGIIADIHINHSTGDVEFICVKLAKGINPSKLPWAATDNVAQVPPSEIDKVEGSIFLRR